MTWSANMKIGDGGLEQCSGCEIEQDCPVRRIMQNLGYLVTGVESGTAMSSGGNIVGECFSKRTSDGK